MSPLTPIKRAIKKCLLPERAGPLAARFGLARGAHLYIDPRHGFRYLYGLYEMELRATLRALVRPGARAFDIGGGWGYYAAVLWRLGGGPVVTFEPQAENGEAIRAMIAANGADAGITLDPRKVGPRPGDGWTTLDDAAAEYFVPDVVKMDIEGAEADALRGAGSLLARGTTAFVIEVHAEDIERACLALLAKADYRCAVIDRWRLGEGLYRTGFNRWLAARPPRTVSR